MDLSHLDTGPPSQVDTTLDTVQSPGEPSHTRKSPLGEVLKAVEHSKPDQLRTITRILEEIARQKELDGETAEQVSSPSNVLLRKY
jgi:hypothetical protein